MSLSTYLPTLGLGLPTLPEHLEFWRHCSRRELRFQRCSGCGQWRHPPAPVCPHCGSAAAIWEQAPARAELFAFTVVHHAAAPALRDYVPYNIAIVSFAGLGDVRLVSNVIDVARDELRIGMPLNLAWQDHGSGRMVPVFLAGANP